jgi:hypothetical protein
VTYNWAMAPARSDGSIAGREESPAKAITTGSLKTAWLTQRFLWLLFPVTLGLAITRQSLWIDEGYTVWFASHRSITTFFSALIGSPGAPGDPQMLFYLFYMWAWVKPFGESEWALRAANIPFAILFMVTLSWASRHLLRQPNLWVFFCLSPFFWFYLNEARPYVALLAFSAVSIIALLAYLMHSAEYRTSAPWWCLIALLLACGTHIMGAFLFPSMVVLAALTGAGDANIRQRFLRDWYRPILWCSPAFVALASFYVWASTYGVNKGHGRPGLSNLAFIVYEFLGFGGLGPPRDNVRNTPHLYAFTPYWPWLLPGATALAIVGFLLLRTRPPKLVSYLIASLLVGTAIGVEISIVEHFQVLGRHMAAFFPLLLITLMLWSQHSFSSKRARYVGIAAFVALGVAWGISDLRLVFMSQYAKDDYREAASTATARALQDGGKILWAADPHTAHYYGILVMTDHRTVEIGKDDGIDWDVSAEALDARNWNIREARKFVSTQRVPAILVLSKTDLFDTNDGWRTLIQQHRPLEVAHLTAFSIYELQPTTSSADGER